MADKRSISILSYSVKNLVTWLSANLNAKQGTRERPTDSQPLFNVAEDQSTLKLLIVDFYPFFLKDQSSAQPQLLTELN